MNVSPSGRAYTAHSEGLSLTAYPDNGACSIGYGHRGVSEGSTCTPEQAEAWLAADLDHAVATLNDREIVKVDLTQGQFDALADFIYNVGAAEFKKSTLLRVLNFGEYTRVPDELRRWIYENGKVNEGLKVRREGEVILWNGGKPL